MPIQSYYKKGTIISVCFLLLSLFSIHFIDKPLALFNHRTHLDQLHILMYITEYGIPSWGLFCVIFLCIVPTNNTIWLRVFFFIYLLILVGIAEVIRTKLGIVCGRSWPQTWAHSGIYGSLIQDNHFGFHFFQSPTWKGSFPSGHSMVTTTICCSMYLVYNRYISLWATPIIIMPIFLILLNFHYLGDTLAGIGLGVLISYYGFGLYLLGVKYVRANYANS